MKRKIAVSPILLWKLHIPQEKLCDIVYKWKQDNVVIERFIVGSIETNTYLLTFEDSAILIDPGFPEDELRKRTELLSVLEKRTVLITHGHFDHTGFCPQLQGMGWEVGSHPRDGLLLNRVPGEFDGLGYQNASFKPQIKLAEGMTFDIGDLSLEVFYTPGHSPGSVCFIDRERKIAFTGDTLFVDSIGRTDLPGSKERLLMESLKKLKGLLKPGTLVLPGHGGRALFSNVLRINPYLSG